MPRGGRKEASLKRRPIDDAQFDVLTAASAQQSAVATLEELKKLQRNVRGREQRIRRAKFMATCLTLRMEGFTQEDSAKILGATIEQVRYALMESRREQTIDMLLDRLDQVGLPLAVDNVITGVMDGDKRYTLELLHGRGVFRTHKSVESTVRRTTLALNVKVTRPEHLAPGAPLPSLKPGAVVGGPVKGLEAIGLPPAEVLEGIVVGEAASKAKERDDVD